MRLALVVFNILDNFFNSPLWFFQSAMYGLLRTRNRPFVKNWRLVTRRRRWW